jgi:hypothetical protein
MKNTKVSVILMNWQRPRNIRDLILPKLVQCPIVGEILLCHCNENTIFHCESNQVPIHHMNYIEENRTHGLAIRFLAAAHARHSTIVYMDDDLVVHPATLLNMYQMYRTHTPCIVGRFGRRILSGGIYSTDPIETGTPAPITLTSLVLVDRDFCIRIYSKSSPLMEYIRANANPLWNGEDIFLSLMSIREYGKWPILMDNQRIVPVRKLRSPHDIHVAISQRKGHAEYRSGLIRRICIIYQISSNLLSRPPR